MEIRFESCIIPQLGKKRLRLKKYTSDACLYLGNFLLYDLSITWLETYKKWALNPLATCGSGNETYMEKEGGYIYIGCLFFDDPLEGPCYKLTPKEFIDLLDQWKAAVEARPNVITITKENGRLIVKTEK